MLVVKLMQRRPSGLVKRTAIQFMLIGLITRELRTFDTAIMNTSLNQVVTQDLELKIPSAVMLERRLNEEAF